MQTILTTAAEDDLQALIENYENQTSRKKEEKNQNPENEISVY
ncbi:MAG: hypothetical protein R2860_12530 [Desulfobacterales bacterium]